MSDIEYQVSEFYLEPGGKAGRERSMAVTAKNSWISADEIWTAKGEDTVQAEFDSVMSMIKNLPEFGEERKAKYLINRVRKVGGPITVLWKTDSQGDPITLEATTGGELRIQLVLTSLERKRKSSPRAGPSRKHSKPFVDASADRTTGTMLYSQAQVHLQSIEASNGQLPANVYELMSYRLGPTDPGYERVASTHPEIQPVRCVVSHGPATVNAAAFVGTTVHRSVTAASKELFMFGSRNTIQNTVGRSRQEGGALYVEVKTSGNNTTYEHFGSNGKHGSRPIYFSTADRSRTGVVSSALLAQVQFGTSIRLLQGDAAAFMRTRLDNATENVIVSTSKHGLEAAQQPSDDEDWTLIRLKKPLPWDEDIHPSVPDEAD